MFTGRLVGGLDGFLFAMLADWLLNIFGVLNNNNKTISFEYVLNFFHFLRIKHLRDKMIFKRGEYFFKKIYAPGNVLVK